MELARHGASVVVNDLGGDVRGTGTGGAAEDTVRLIEKAGGRAVASRHDVGDDRQAGELVQQAIDTFGRLDVLVNNAGIVRDAVIWKATPDDFDAVLRVHLKGTFSCCRHAAAHWRARAKAGETALRGRIINTTSGAGLRGNFGQSGYAAAKAGIVGLTLTLALELHRIGVTVNAVGPAGLTRITATIPGAGDAFEPNDVPAEEFHPMDPKNSSPLVAWLASDQAGHVTGQVIRAIHDRIIWMDGWTERAEICSNGKPWQADALGAEINTRLFRTRAAGLEAWA
jgi:NAD(P)-dependent dehydrogenase (short-subunit alcohol dehydrogenase family)